MASLPGGPAEKLGNEFERLWLSRLLLDVVGGKALSVRIEPPTAVALKTECLVARPDGTIESHQCNRENGPAGKWTVLHLKSEGILLAAKLFLSQSPQHRYFFISGDKVPSLSTFHDRAVRFDRIDEFFDEVATNDEDRPQFAALTSLLNLNPAVPKDQHDLVSFLRRFIPVCEDVHQQRARVEEIASFLITGNPLSVVDALESLASTTIRRSIDIDDVRKDLEQKGFKLRDLTKDKNLAVRLDECCDHLERLFEPFLISGRRIGRRETDSLVSAIKDRTKRLILVHGSGGCGKSGVIYECLRRLRGDRVKCLAISLEAGDTKSTVGERLNLPGNPVQCLTAVAQGQPAVLFIDQLDAIRWTSQHSPSAWDTVSQLIDSAIATDNVAVVLGCRTHDANDDPRIKAMIESLQRKQAAVLKLEIAPLSSKEVDQVFQETKLSTGQLSPKQRELLRWPQNLYMWQKIYAAAGGSTFTSSTNLCRAYWDWVRAQLSADQRNELNERILPALIEHSLHLGQDLVPSDIRSKYGQTVGKLLSIGTLVATQSKRVRFGHQSYFDFIAAEDLAAQLRAGTVLTDWLLEHDSLFNRQQLRQLLEMSRDDDPAGFVRSARLILDHSKVRFHLKQLTLQVIASVNTPNDAELELLLECQVKANLSQHIPRLFHGNVAWFDLLDGRGVLARWLTSPDEWLKRQAQWLLNSFVEQRSDAVQRIIQSLPISDRRTALEIALNSRSAASLSDSMFKEHIGLIRTGSAAAIHVDLKKLAVESPRRAARVYRELARRAIRSIRNTGQSDHSQDQIEHVLLNSAEAIRSLAQSHPRTVWSNLCVLIDDICKRRRVEYQRRKTEDFSAGFDRRLALKRLSKLTVRILVPAGRRIARQWPEDAWARCAPLTQSTSCFKQRIGLRCLIGLDKSYADRVLALLSAKTELLRCGAKQRGSRYEASMTFPARRFLRRFGPNADGKLLDDIVVAIQSIVTPNEKAIWRYAHDCFMGRTRSHGPAFKHYMYPRTIFACQYALLDSYPIDRMSSDTRDWFGVLSRKFGLIAPILKEPPRSVAGFIGSSIPESRLKLLPDKSWLRIIGNDAVTNSNHFGTRRALSLTESTPRMFSRQLEGLAQRDPARFARLCMRVPISAPVDYVVALIRALGETKPPPKAPTVWAPAPSSLIEPVLERFSDRCDDRDVAIAFGWLLNNRAGEPWSNATLTKLVEIAQRHPNPEPKYATIIRADGPSAESEPDYVTTAINCVRGVAACAIGSLLWHDKGRLAILEPAIKAFENDPHPSVRIAATRVAISLLNIDRAKAIQYCLSINSHSSDDVLRGNELSEFLGYTILNDFMKVEPLLQRMLASSVAKVTEYGAQWALLAYLHKGKMKDEVSSCLKGSVSHRTGLATILSHELATRCCDDTAIGWWTTLLNDSDESMRRIISSTFLYREFYSQPCARQALISFTKSVAFDGNLDHAIHGLNETAVPLTGFTDVIHAIVERLGDVAIAPAKSEGLAFYYLPNVLLRLYEQSESDPATRQRCLDLLDKSLQSPGGYDMTKVVDD